ncbi:hypothetical protein Tco_1554688 [Tanacetum coccineum]
MIDINTTGIALTRTSRLLRPQYCLLCPHAHRFAFVSLAWDFPQLIAASEICWRAVLGWGGVVVLCFGGGGLWGISELWRVRGGDGGTFGVVVGDSLGGFWEGEVFSDWGVSSVLTTGSRIFGRRVEWGGGAVRDLRVWGLSGE